MDNYSTPINLATLMVNAIQLPLGTNDIVADFAAGEGTLLEVAQLKWPDAKIVASDIDLKITRSLKKIKGNWRICSCDFLNPKSTGNSPLLRRLVGRTKLIIINPPFSCRGGKKVLANIRGASVECSVGMAFFVNSVNFLSIGGELIGILPLGVLTSERDEKAWELLKKYGEITTIKFNGDNVFHKATVHTAVVKFVRKQLKPKKDKTNLILNADTPKKSTALYRLVRGSTQMDCAEKAKGLEGVILIHSTDLRSGKLGNGLIVNNNNTKLVTGPMILINRVGRPNKEKLICLTEAKTFGLSDCVFALLCPSIKGAIQIWNSIKSNWDLLEKQYGGSGAKYLTIRKYLTYLNNIGYQVKAE